MRFLALLITAPMLALIWNSATYAHHASSPLREATLQGHTHAVGGATFWLAGAAIAMVVALIAVQMTVFRKR